jgi:polyisoprenoid-binding protein YceI
MGIGTGGTLGGLQTEVNFNPTDPANSSIEASVDVATINTGNTSKDEHLKSEDFFDVARYPKISLKLISFKHKSGSNYLGRFNLTIKAITKPVDIPFTYTEKNNALAFKSTFKINRLDFGVGSTSLVLADEVSVNIDAEAGK